MDDDDWTRINRLEDGRRLLLMIIAAIGAWVIIIIGGYMLWAL